MKNNNDIFKKIILHKTSTNIIYQDELVTAFHDIYPKSPIHILIVPNKFIATLNDINQTHELILGRMLLVSSKIAKKTNINKNGYRIVINCNKHGCQEIFYLHLHLLGGRQGIKEYY
ncbi:histidine triad nucleotide-binding protein [Enterobacteriaceae endosymbiont of Plateumaris braccata]|uniref:histidine triad nucleotide-binding protein n=1 Tax=Enterobacteriaceae endosymbiont of Plateumaris braccata TaxID=2675793 RepID=UPI00144A14BB|nr:histidine triad nucleotide-binding protein [Enterobacteriaceae endosymbiont of Plateumaris braccata]QJC28054.1 HIT domain-containing protein [Enterobacteriaceae endosymbiont of Plateumaris braccata]